jgi:hypothetical protein
MAVGLEGDAEALAEAVHAKLARYEASAWRYERDLPAPAQARHAFVHRILKLADGKGLKGLSVRNLRRVFATVAKKAASNGHARGR